VGEDHENGQSTDGVETADVLTMVEQGQSAHLLLAEVVQP
jgi:hypothetical protein